MDYDKLNRWLTLATNVAVVSGIFLLVVELRQNQESLELDSRLAALESSHLDVSRFTEWRAKFINNPQTTKLFLNGAAGKELTDVDQFRFNALCNDLFWAAALMHERSVVLGRVEYERATVAWMQQIIGEPGTESCWQELRGIYLMWGYGDFVDAVEEAD